MSGYRFGITCPVCGAELEHVASGTSNGVSTRAVVRCNDGCVDFIINLSIAIQGRHRVKGEPKPCGTNAAYNRHARPVTCEPCLKAHADYIAASGRSHHRRTA